MYSITDKDTYKHFKEFIAVCDKLWEMRLIQRLSFVLVGPGRDYVVTTKGVLKIGTTKNYKSVMLGSDKQTYGGWSVSNYGWYDERCSLCHV